MIPITETPDLYPETVPLVETTDPVLGGPAGPANAAAIALANRTRWLKAAIEAIEAETGLGVTVEDVGEGASLFVEKVGAALRFLTLLEGNNITLTPTPTGLRIDATGGTGTTPDTHITVEATPDFVPGPGSTGTGTDNSAAINAAIAAGLAANKPLYLDTGNYYVANPDTLRALNRINIAGPGQIFGPTNVGITEIGRTLNVGTSRSHEVDFVGGLLLGGESGDGLRQWMGHHNWMQWQPTRPGAPTQVQIYNSANLCAATCQAPDILNASYGTFPIDRMAVGDHVGWNGALYKIAALTSTGQIRVTKFDGSPPAFVTDAVNPRFFAHAYETATGTCNVSGSTVTYVSGDQYPYGYNGDHMYAIINGTRHTVTAGPETVGANNLTLSAPAGTLTGASITFRRCHGPWAYVSLLRLQGLAGGVETTAGLYINIRGEAVLFSGATLPGLAGPLRINATRIRLGQDDGLEFLEVGYRRVTLGGITGDTATNTLSVITDGPLIAPQLKAEGPADHIDIVMMQKGNGRICLGVGTNNLLVLPGAAGFAPALIARGPNALSPSDMGFDIDGYGTFNFSCNAFAQTALKLFAAEGPTYPTLACGAETILGVGGAAANIDLSITAKGTGVIRHKSMPVCAFTGSTWANVTVFSNGFAVYSGNTPVGYRKESDNNIRLKGALSSSGGTNAATAFTLPVGFRPPQVKIFPGYDASFLQIDPDGTVHPSWGTNPGIITLDGITFPTV